MNKQKLLTLKTLRKILPDLIYNIDQTWLVDFLTEWINMLPRDTKILPGTRRG